MARQLADRLWSPPTPSGASPAGHISMTAQYYARRGAGACASPSPSPASLGLGREELSCTADYWSSLAADYICSDEEEDVRCQRYVARTFGAPRPPARSTKPGSPSPSAQGPEGAGTPRAAQSAQALRSAKRERLSCLRVVIKGSSARIITTDPDATDVSSDEDDSTTDPRLEFLAPATPTGPSAPAPAPSSKPAASASTAPRHSPAPQKRGAAAKASQSQKPPKRAPQHKAPKKPLPAPSASPSAVGAPPQGVALELATPALCHLGEEEPTLICRLPEPGSGRDAPGSLLLSPLELDTHSDLLSASLLLGTTSKGEDAFACLPGTPPTPTSHPEEKACDALAPCPGAGTKRKLAFSRASSNNSLGSCTLSSGSASAPSHGATGKRCKAETSSEGLDSGSGVVNGSALGDASAPPCGDFFAEPAASPAAAAVPYWGVRQVATSGKWAAEILDPTCGRVVLLGFYDFAETAAMAYDAAARAIRGPSARTNFPSAVEASLGRCMVGSSKGCGRTMPYLGRRPLPRPDALPSAYSRSGAPLGCRGSSTALTIDLGDDRAGACGAGSSMHDAANALWNSPLAAKGCGDLENSGDSSVVTGDTGSVERAARKKRGGAKQGGAKGAAPVKGAGAKGKAGEAAKQPCAWPAMGSSTWEEELSAFFPGEVFDNTDISLEEPALGSAAAASRRVDMGAAAPKEEKTEGKCADQLLQEMPWSGLADAELSFDDIFGCPELPTNGEPLGGWPDLPLIGDLDDVLMLEAGGAIAVAAVEEAKELAGAPGREADFDMSWVAAGFCSTPMLAH